MSVPEFRELGIEIRKNIEQGTPNTEFRTRVELNVCYFKGVWKPYKIESGTER